MLLLERNCFTKVKRWALQLYWKKKLSDRKKVTCFHCERLENADKFSCLGLPTPKHLADYWIPLVYTNLEWVCDFRTIFKALFRTPQLLQHCSVLREVMPQSGIVVARVSYTFYIFQQLGVTKEKTCFNQETTVGVTTRLGTSQTMVLAASRCAG